MRLEFVEDSEFRAVFILRDAPIAFANSFRRAMKSLVPTMAVDYVDVYLNTSYLYDEILAHRIGLIPLKTNLEKFNMPDECSCGGEGCPNCQVSLRLNVEGPKLVYSGDFVSDDPETVPVYDNIPVVELYKGQQLMIEAVARLGTGKEHSKYQPVSICAYKVIPRIEISGECNGCGDCVNACSRNVLEAKDGKIEVKNILSCSMCMECVNVCTEEAIKVEDTNDFLFTVEGVGSLPVRTVMRKALEILKKKAEEMNSILALG
ncbi:DNA-directed RNA polymerase subunit D [Archaeoglobus veneficus]|uniref:DNA-directed RNA polymerase subunit Rpo3 n=1 Tax=Archaeoglobus veneficus (strain DSM 11195 / SNP6) TaxID=693661 RepID=F2KPG5_ARCVS|nr:DNA-directed RNA polymerase subunit D [Archaeoglobus veneficus]AEA46396.1 DNA-directed RNA polymerase subunit D [Archaeoglobus veneficus SNP6]